jgi:ABC-type sugar transport system substrate-binding protein
MMKKLFITALLFVACFSVFANGTADSDTSDEKMIKAAFIPQDMATESQSFSAKMFEKYAPEYGFKLTILDGKGDPQIQAQLVTNAIAQKLDVIFINPADTNALIPSLMQAKQAGLIVAMFSSDVPKDKAEVRDFFVGVNDNMAGESAGQAFLNHFPSGANVIEIGGQAGHDAQNKRHDGFNKVIAGSNIHVIDYKACAHWATADAMAIMEDMIVKHGDEIDGIFCHWDNGATGIIEAMKAAGMEGKFIVAVDGNRAGFDQVKSGQQGATIMQNFENMSRKSLELAKAMMEGKAVESVNFVPLDIVTLDTIDEFTPPEW